MNDDGDGHSRVRKLVSKAMAAVRNALGAGPVHRRRLADIDTRIVVSGIRGKSTTVRWLHEAFHNRGFDTFSKVTGTEPQVMYNGSSEQIDRNEEVRLYENERVLSGHSDIDVAIFENQGIREYTTRLVNEQYVKPDVVFLTNVREDHLDTLGQDRRQIARSLARSVPRNTPVVCGEQEEPFVRYVAAELDRRNAPMTTVDIPPAHRDVPGAECVFGLNTVLSTMGEPPLPRQQILAYLDELRPEWQVLPGGRVYNAADANDTQSTELVRRSLVGSSGTIVEPLVNLRADRRGRTVSFIRYLGELYRSDAIETAHLVGDNKQLFETQTDFRVQCHDETARSPEEVLDEALAAGRPVMLMGNTVTEFMQALAATVEERSQLSADRTNDRKRHTPG